MRKIIEGKRYDTETATSIGSRVGGESRSDFRWFKEALYRTPRGNYFLAGKGGPMSHYAEPCGDGWQGGDKITVLSAAEALDWASRHLDAGEVEAEFGDKIEDA